MLPDYLTKIWAASRHIRGTTERKKRTSAMSSKTGHIPCKERLLSPRHLSPINILAKDEAQSRLKNPETPILRVTSLSLYSLTVYTVTRKRRLLPNVFPSLQILRSILISTLTTNHKLCRRRRNHSFDRDNIFFYQYSFTLFALP